jgi:lipoprotein-releasing system permease protein
MKHVFSKRRKAGLSFMTYASIFGVTLGVAALVITLSVMGGFESDLKSRMFKGLPHMEVYHENPFVGFSLNEHPVDKFKSTFPKAKYVEPFVKADVVLKNRNHLSSVVIFGLEKGSKGALWGFGEGMILGDLDLLHKDLRLPGIVLGEDLAIELGVDVGDEVIGLSPGANISDALGGMELSKTFEVVGVFRTDLSKFDSKYAVVSLEHGRFFMADYDESLQEENYVSGMALNFKNPESIDLFVENLNNFPSMKATTWKEVNKSLLFALTLEKFTMSAVLFLIVLVAAFSIAATVMMTVYYKRHQISLFRALGMKIEDVLKMFISHGAVIGGAGVVLGLSVGLAGCFLIESIGSIPLPQGVYMLQSLPVKYLYMEYVIIAISAFLITVFSSIYPAYIAANREPGEGLRY